MKRLILILIVVLHSGFINAQNSKVSSSSVINNLDTVVFDISQAVQQGSTVTFPVSFLSDDTINALDFSFLFNMTDFTYDTILDLTNYMTTLSFMGFDQRVRFTSYSFQNYTNDTALASISFISTTGTQFCDTDLDSVKAYLNGDACTVKIITCVPNSVRSVDKGISVQLYPNPADDVLNIISDKEAKYIVTEIDGKTVVKTGDVKAGQQHLIFTGNLASGIYILKVFNNDLKVFQKVVVNR